jgi:hypothetical protein
LPLSAPAWYLIITDYTYQMVSFERGVIQILLKFQTQAVTPISNKLNLGVFVISKGPSKKLLTVSFENSYYL